MKKIVLALGLSAIALAGTAYAAQAGALGPQVRAMMADPLGNATVTRAEAQAKAGELFDRLDLNHDGKLDQADRDVRVMQHFDEIDTNHDGTISKDEFLAAHRRMMEHGPGMPGAMGGPGPMADHDMGQHEMGRHDMDRGHGERDHMGHGHMGPGEMRGRGAGMAMALLGQADANHDGVVTRQEFVAAALKRFDAADTNHDGKVTLAERRAAFRAMHDMPPPPAPTPKP